MKHIKDAQKEFDQGRGVEALAIVENILGLAPKNPEALRIKAHILESSGQFESALEIWQKLAKMPNLEDKTLEDLEERSLQDKEALFFSEMTHEGRCFFAFPKSQVWVSLLGLMGCLGFLAMSPRLLSTKENFSLLILSFTFLVLVPWAALIGVHLWGIKKVLVSPLGIKVFTRFRSRNINWSEVSCVVMESDSDLRKDYLVLHVYGQSGVSKPVVSFDLSKSSPVVRARRHFARSVLNWVPIVIYKKRHEPLNFQPSPPAQNGVNDILDNNNPPSAA